MIEEIGEAEARAQFDTNVFGTLWITQAAVARMREQGAGHVLQVSSIGGVTAAPYLGMYTASKWALEAFSQSLAGEVAQFGIKVTIIEPAGFSTDFLSRSSVQHSAPNPAYDALREQVTAIRDERVQHFGDPSASAAAVLALVDAAEPPLRVFFGKAPLPTVTAEYESRLATWREWNHLSIAAHGG